MNRIRIGRPGAGGERRWPGALSPDPRDPGIAWATGARAGRAVRNGARDMMARANAFGYMFDGVATKPRGQ
jgi:hypothetical protein